ncbi:MAG: acyltransferase domain-containing protein [Acidimicrobiales bacterium]
MPAFVFPGQGSERPGMGTPWTGHPSWEVVEEASKAAGRDVGRLLLDATAGELAETRNAQLSTFTISLVVLDAVERLGIEPTGVAGHSVGEYTALAASGALGFEDAVRVVAERGEAMQAAADAHPGVMAVVSGCDADTVDIACRLADGDVWVANYNSSEETVIAGSPGAVARAEGLARELGASKVGPVAAGGAFHTSYMRPARDRLQKAISMTPFYEAETPVVTNVDALPHVGAADWASLLCAQLCNPVRWRQSLLRLGGLSDRGTDTERLFVELGPGDSLTTMVRHTLPSVATATVSVPADLDRLVDAVSGDTALHTYALVHQGEQLYVSERVVISPGPGIFEPAPHLDGDAGVDIQVGTLIGTVGSSEVRSPFAGRLEGVLAHRGERVQTGQPIAWLHAS